jgi:ferredoxin, 2Fe-2S
MSMSTIKVTWVTRDGRHIEGHVPIGHTLMEAAISNDVPGVLGECGGSLACATCHVIVAEESNVCAEPPGDNEREMLDLGPIAPSPRSRLSCQLSAEPQLDGIILLVPSP